MTKNSRGTHTCGGHLISIGLQGGAMNISVCTDNDQIAGDLDLLEASLAKDDEIISERLNVLAGLLAELKNG